MYVKNIVLGNTPVRERVLLDLQDNDHIDNQT